MQTVYLSVKVCARLELVCVLLGMCVRRCPAIKPAALILVSRLLGETQWTISCL